MLSRYFNEREGFDAKRDMLPRRFFGETLTVGGRRYSLSMDEYLGGLRRYYKAWSIREDGRLEDGAREDLEELLESWELRCVS